MFFNPKNSLRIDELLKNLVPFKPVVLVRLSIKVITVIHHAHELTLNYGDKTISIKPQNIKVFKFSLCKCFKGVNI